MTDEVREAEELMRRGLELLDEADEPVAALWLQHALDALAMGAAA